MSRRTSTLALAIAGALTIAGSAHAASVKLLTMIPVPGEPIESYDDAKTNEWIQNIPAPPNAHSVVVNHSNGHILVLSGKTGGFCGGCILVFGENWQA
jgi:hypothetical protein